MTPRYRRVADVEDLVVRLRETTRGLTIQEIVDIYDVSRRTAERMIESIGERFEVETVVSAIDRKKRWRIGATRFVPPRLEEDEFDALQRAARSIREGGDRELASAVTRIAEKLRTLR